MQELVSIIMPCRNAEKTLVKAIESVLLQDYENLELFIIDDGSTDSSASIASLYQAQDNRVKTITNPGPHGVSNARNIGIHSACGKYICFLDADDYLLPESISTRISIAKASSANVVYGPYLKLLPNGRLVRKSPPTMVTFNDMLKINHIGNLTGMYNAEALGKFLQEDIKHEDYLMWCQILKKSRYARSTGDKPIAVYRVSPNSLSGNKLKSFLWHWNVIRQGLSKGLLKSIYYQLFYLYTSLSDRFFEKFQKQTNEFLHHL